MTVPTPKPATTISRIIARAAALLLPAALVFGAYFTSTVISFGLEAQRFEVPYGQTDMVQLADGSTVWLNAGSVLEYPVRFTGMFREVRLSGEGFFDIAKNPDKPFIVRTANSTTEVKGTEFNIRCCDITGREEITVISGVVEVSTKDNQTFRLTDNSHLSLEADGTKTEKKLTDASAAIRWRESGLVFDDSTLEDILHSLQRKYGFDMLLDPGLLTGSVYRIQFVNGENLDYILEVIHSLVGFPYTYENNLLTIGCDHRNMIPYGKNSISIP